MEVSVAAKHFERVLLDFRDESRHWFTVAHKDDFFLLVLDGINHLPEVTNGFGHGEGFHFSKCIRRNWIRNQRIASCGLQPPGNTRTRGVSGPPTESVLSLVPKLNSQPSHRVLEVLVPRRPSVPAGRAENSPAIHCRVSRFPFVASRGDAGKDALTPRPNLKACARASGVLTGRSPFLGGIPGDKSPGYFRSFLRNDAPLGRPKYL